MPEGLSGRTVLVTGATGFLGRRLLARLRAITDVRRVALTRSEPPANDDNVTWIRTSLEEIDAETWKRADLARIDTVFHLGAFTPKSADEVNRIDAIYRDNLIGLRALLESLPDGVKSFVFASTLDVYAPTAEGVSLDEESLTAPAGLYGASKLFGETLVRIEAKRRGFTCAVLRYGHLFGPGEEAYRKLIPQTIRQLRRGDLPTLHGDGGALRDFLYVDDAVEATVRAAALGDLTGPLNIVRGESRPIREIVEILVGLTGFDGGIKFLTDRDPGRSLRFDAGRMRAALGSWPLVSLEDGLREEADAFAD